jgi:hypothetical protein
MKHYAMPLIEEGSALGRMFDQQERIANLEKKLKKLEVAKTKAKPDRACRWCQEAFTYPSLLKKHLALKSGECAKRERGEKP